MFGLILARQSVINFKIKILRVLVVFFLSNDLHADNENKDREMHNQIAIRYIIWMNLRYATFLLVVLLLVVVCCFRFFSDTLGSDPPLNVPKFVDGAFRLDFGLGCVTTCESIIIEYNKNKHVNGKRVCFAAHFHFLFHQ